MLGNPTWTPSRAVPSIACRPEPYESRRVYLRLLTEAGAPPHVSDVVRELGGRFYPAAVAAALRDLGLRYRTENGDSHQRPYAIELHALDYEWYFERDTVNWLASLFPREANVLFIGTPTVAAVRAQSGAYLRLIDSNPLVTRRFPTLAYSRIHIGRIQQVRRTYDEPDYILLDAPWNFSDVMTWIRFAHAHARRGTQILSTLFPAETRPTARVERARVLALAERIGRSTISYDALRYETPLFEREALQAEGIRGVGTWRTGDLLSIRVERLDTTWDRLVRAVAATRDRSRERWTSFTLGSQVLKLRATPSHQSRSVLTSVPGCPNDVLPSVSARDHRRKQVGIWTSRNRVASVSRPTRVARVLHALERGRTYEEALDSAAHRGTPIDQASSVLLRRILGLD
jgi:hypothetical protein